MISFEDILFLFNSSVKNRYLIRLNLLEAGLLFKTAAKAPGNILEIGTKIGGSSVLLAAAAGDRKVYSVDIIPHRNRKKGRVLDKITPTNLIEKIDFIVEESTSVANRWEEKLGLIFIDGDHTPEAVARDIVAWKPHVMKGGYMAFHDIGVAGTKNGKKLVIQLHKIVNSKMAGWEKIGHVQSLLILQNNE